MLKKGQAIQFTVIVKAVADGMDMTKSGTLTITTPSDVDTIDRMDNYLGSAQESGVVLAGGVAKDLLHAVYLNLTSQMVKEQMKGKEPGKTGGVQ